jgi:PTH1 family peptidyl-tRNA hydrolase
LRESGGSGGHRGVESTIHALGSSDFPRLRVGIGRAGKRQVVEHVLSAWTAEERPVVEVVLAAATDAVLYSFRRGVAAAMNAFNGWEPQPAAEQGMEHA